MNAPGWEKSLAKLDDFFGELGGRVFASFFGFRAQRDLI